MMCNEQDKDLGANQEDSNNEFTCQTFPFLNPTFISTTDNHRAEICLRNLSLWDQTIILFFSKGTKSLTAFFFSFGTLFYTTQFAELAAVINGLKHVFHIS